MNANRQKSRQDIGTRLAQARLEAGYVTAKEFSDKNGIPQPTYWSHETGKRRPDDDTLAFYAARLGVSPQWLILGSGPARPEQQAAPPPKDRLHQIMAALKNVSEDDLDLVESLVHRLELANRQSS